MRKYLYVFIIFILSCLFVSSAYGKNLDLVIKESECTAKGVTVKYAFINYRKFNRPNITVVFKVIVDGHPIGCKKINTTVPLGANGSDIKETLIDAPSCKGKDAKIIYRLFTGSAKRYLIDNWLKDCR